MTSNVGSHIILHERGDTPSGHERMRNEVLEALRQQFRPEFLNRVDEIVVFHALTREQLKQIVHIQLERLRGRLAERKIELVLSEAALDHFAATGYDPTYGARPLKRLLQRELETTLGRRLLDGTVTENSRVIVDVERDEIQMRSEPLDEAA
jgi:ATP-dependent Clp protease ATP-binding subunit ClpB